MAHPHTDACAPPQDSVTLRPSHTLPRAHRGVRRVASPLASPPFAHSCQWNFHRESQWVVALLSLLKTSSLVPTEPLPQPFTLVPESSQMRAVASVLSSALCPSFFTLSLQVLIPFQSEHITAFHCPDGGQTAVCGYEAFLPASLSQQPWQIDAGFLPSSPRAASPCSVLPPIPGLALLACFVCWTLSSLLPPSLDWLLVLHLPVCLDPCLSNKLRWVLKRGFKCKIDQIIASNTSSECQDSHNSNAKTFPNAETVCRP